MLSIIKTHYVVFFYPKLWHEIVKTLLRVDRQMLRNQFWRYVEFPAECVWCTIRRANNLCVMIELRRKDSLTRRGYFNRCIWAQYYLLGWPSERNTSQLPTWDCLFTLLRSKGWGHRSLGSTYIPQGVSFSVPTVISFPVEMFTLSTLIKGPKSS